MILRARKTLIYDLCDGDPECVKACQEAEYNCLRLINERRSVNRKLFSRLPLDVTKDLAAKFFGEKGEEGV